MGVLQTFTTGFFESINHAQPFYLGKHKATVNKRIAKCKFPFECSRVLRSLDDIKFWKASEWKQWMLLCSSLLDGLLNTVYLKHLVLFTNSMCLLRQDEISPQDLRKASELIYNFCN